MTGESYHQGHGQPMEAALSELCARIDGKVGLDRYGALLEKWAENRQCISAEGCNQTAAAANLTSRGPAKPGDAALGSTGDKHLRQLADTWSFLCWKLASRIFRGLMMAGLPSRLVTERPIQVKLYP